MQNLHLAEIEAVRFAIEAASTVQEIKETLDAATAAKVYAEQARLGQDIKQKIAEYIVRAERKLGEILQAATVAGQIGRGNKTGANQYKSGNVVGGDISTFTLEEAGITRDLSSRAQKISAISSADFEQKVTELKETGKLTANAVVRSRHQANGEKPAGRRSNIPAKEHDRQAEVALLYDEGKTANEIALALDLTHHQVANIIKSERTKRSAQANIDPETLSLTARQKLEMAIKQHTEKLTAEWRIAVNARVTEFLADTIGPSLQREQNQARAFMKSRKGVMDRKTYRKIWACLHPDRIADPEMKPLYEEAFRLFTAAEKLLLDETSSPTEYVGIPKTSAEWDELKRQATAARQAKRSVRSGIQTK